VGRRERRVHRAADGLAARDAGLQITHRVERSHPLSPDTHLSRAVAPRTHRSDGLVDTGDPVSDSVSNADSVFVSVSTSVSDSVGRYRGREQLGVVDLPDEILERRGTFAEVRRPIANGKWGPHGNERLDHRPSSGALVGKAHVRDGVALHVDPVAIEVACWRGRRLRDRGEQWTNVTVQYLRFVTIQVRERQEHVQRSPSHAHGTPRCPTDDRARRRIARGLKRAEEYTFFGDEPHTKLRVTRKGACHCATRRVRDPAQIGSQFVHPAVPSSSMFARPRTAVAMTLAVGIATLSNHAHATPRWVDRLLTLPGPVAGSIDIGGTIAHADQDLGLPPPVCQGNCSWNGTGVSVDAVIGIASRVDIGLRVGFRGFNDNGNINEGAVANADSYGRFYDQLTFIGAYPNLVYGDYAVTNPELHVRVRILHIKHIFELGVEGRTIFPFAAGTVATQIVGVPMALHFGRVVRFDFGGYTDFIFRDAAAGGAIFTLDLPAAFWFQVHDRVFLGPMFGFRVYSTNVYPAGSVWQNADFNLGFGLGVSLARYVDFKFQVYFPRIEDGAQYVGAGAGVGFYFR
jgi:hypothetical protein